MALAVVVAAAAAAGATCWGGRGAALTAETDADGYFVAEPRWTGDVYPGPGVKFVAWDEEHRRILGRMDEKTTTALVREKAAGGFVAQTIEPSKSSKSHRDGALAALSRQLAQRYPPVPPPSRNEEGLFSSRPGSPLRAFMAAVVGGPAPRAGATPAQEIAVADDSGSPHGPVGGLDLAAWVPARGGVFVRFRSVEAAYRVVEELDHLAGSALAIADGDARDYGTLRLVLHDLLLPTIWRTNPESERGVGEVAVFVERPLHRGRMAVAAILRVTDPELHRMQTEAGIADEARPEHLWRPADDPFPKERARRNFRRRVADVEIVATSGRLLQRIAERRFASLDADAGYATCRWGAPDAPRAALASDEAAFYYDSADDPAGAMHEPPSPDAHRVEREAAGVDWLLRHCIGDGAAPAEVAAPDGWQIGMQGVRLCRVTTDARGMAVGLRYRAGLYAHDAWDMIRAEMLNADVAAARTTSACLHNLADLVPLALVENPQDDVAERNFVVLGWKPVCPCGGTYTVHPITREVSCSVHGTVKSPKSGRWTPPPISDVTVNGAELSFRLAIDWNRQR